MTLRAEHSGQPRPTPAGSGPSARRLEIHGHRGARGLLPENTLPGFERALALGVDALELDIGMTRDGVPVVHHDRALDPDRTRGPGGAWLEPPGPLLRTLNLADLSRFDVGRVRPGSAAAGRFPHREARDGTPIPTLAQVLALGTRPKGRAVRFCIEIKLSPLAPDETAGPEAFAEAVATAVQAAGMQRRAQIMSFDWRVLRAIGRLVPGLALVCLTAEGPRYDTVGRGRPGPSPWTAGLDIDDHGGSLPRLVRRAGGAIWSPWHGDLSDGALAEARRLGLKVVVWTVNEVGAMQALARRGVDGIVTDYPDRAAAALAPWRRPAGETAGETA